MGKKQFKRAIKDKDYDKDDMELALDVWRSDKNLKRNYILNDYVDKPQDFIDDILDNEELKLEAKIKILNKEINSYVPKDFTTIFENEKCVLLCVGNWRTNHYLAVNYLRQKNDGEKFGSGPSWCIADDENGAETWEHYGFDEGEYPNVYMLLSKHDSFIRYQITLKYESIEKYFNEGGSYYEEEFNYDTDEWEEVEKKYDINDLFFEVRNINQELTEVDGVYEDIKSKLGLSKEDIIKIISDNKNRLKGFKNNYKNEHYQIREKINELNEEIETLTTDYEFLIAKTLIDKLSITSQNYNRGDTQRPLMKIRDIYIRHKNCNIEYLNYIFDYFYVKERGNNNSDRNIFKKYSFNIKDFDKICKLAEDEIKYQKNDFLSSFLSIFYKNKPISVGGLIDNNLHFFIESSNYFYGIIDDIIENEIEKCVNGNIYDLFKIAEDEDITDIINDSISFRIATGIHNKNLFDKDRIKEMEFCKNWVENKNLPVDYYTKLCFAIYSQKFTKPYDFNLDKNMDDFINNFVDAPERYLDLIKLDSNVSKKITNTIKEKILNSKKEVDDLLQFIFEVFKSHKLFSEEDAKKISSFIKQGKIYI